MKVEHPVPVMQNAAIITILIHVFFMTYLLNRTGLRLSGRLKNFYLRPPVSFLAFFRRSHQLSPTKNGPTGPEPKPPKSELWRRFGRGAEAGSGIGALTAGKLFAGAAGRALIFSGSGLASGWGPSPSTAFCRIDASISFRRDWAPRSRSIRRELRRSISYNFV